MLRSRRGTDLTRAFPDIVAAATRDLPADVLLDGELVVWDGTRLAFEQLGRRLGRSPAGAARLATELPAHMVLFDLLDQGGVHWAGRPYAERRAALEALFVQHGLGPPWTLCPATVASDQETIETWMSWSVAGIEGVVVKDPAQRYLPGRRAWGKIRVRHSTEAVLGGVVGSLGRPSGLLLGRFDAHGRLRYTGRTARLPIQEAQDLAALLTPAAPAHPWQGITITVGWGTRETLDVALVEPLLVVEVGADVALDAAGRWRHPVRFLRLRADIQPTDTPLFGSGNDPSTG
jgi:ATP-dependent DNA ligase